MFMVHTNLNFGWLITQTKMLTMTLYRTIYRDDVPLADFTTNISCANETTDFFGTGSVTSGTIQAMNGFLVTAILLFYRIQHMSMILQEVMM